MSDALLRQAQALLATTSAPGALRDSALNQLQRWCSAPTYACQRPALQALVDSADGPALLDAFYQLLPFGTGGRRGRVGVGPNRLNDWTVGQAATGHARWLLRHHPHPQIAIGYDVRPSSRRFAEVAARCYAALGLHVWLPPAGAPCLTTPELSFAVRSLALDAGLMITASHNPPSDNGLKLYNAAGAQLVAPEDAEVMACVASATPAAGRAITPTPLDVREAYLQAVVAQLRSSAHGAKLVYSALHGCGHQVIDSCLRRAGFSVHSVARQVPDGVFSTLPGGSANPEDPAVFALALQEAEGADLILVTDPDADRVGAAVRDDDGAWRPLDGHAIAVLVVDYALRHGAKRVIQTAVTSRLVGALARAHGADLIDDLPVGFKHITATLARLEADEGGTRPFIAVEESHGVLWGDVARDKDAASGALLLAAAASEARAQGSSLWARHQTLQRRHGPVHTLKRAVRRPGAEGAAAIHRQIQQLERTPPALGGVTMQAERIAGGALCLSQGAARIVLRPSGTEPTLKAYIEAPDSALLKLLGDELTRWLGQAPGAAARHPVDQRRDP